MFCIIATWVFHQKCRLPKYLVPPRNPTILTNKKPVSDDWLSFVQDFKLCSSVICAACHLCTNDILHYLYLFVNCTNDILHEWQAAHFFFPALLTSCTLVSLPFQAFYCLSHLGLARGLLLRSDPLNFMGRRKVKIYSWLWRIFFIQVVFIIKSKIIYLMEKTGLFYLFYFLKYLSLKLWPRIMHHPLFHILFFYFYLVFILHNKWVNQSSQKWFSWYSFLTIWFKEIRHMSIWFIE